MPRPLALSLLSPPAQDWHGHPVTLTVWNIGADTVRVTVVPVLLHAGCRTTAEPHIRVSRAGFTLTPGRKGSVVVSSVPATGGDYGVVFRAVVPGVHGDVLAGAVGAQVLSGGAVSCVPPHPRPVIYPSPGFPWLPLTAAVVFLAAVAAAAGIWWRRRRLRPASR